MKLLPKDKGYINREQHNQYSYLFCAIPLALLFVVLIVSSLHAGFSDFASYYFGSRLLLAGNYQNAYENIKLNQWIYEQGYHGIFASYTPFPPFTAIVFSLFTLLPVETAKLLFNILSATAFTITLTRSFKYFSISPYILFLIPVLFFSPLRNNIFFGQSYLLLCFLLLEGYIAFAKNQTWRSAVLWAIAILFKIFPVVIIVFLLIKKQYKKLVYLFIVCAGLGVVSLFVNGFACWEYYFKDLFPRLNNGELNDSFTWIFQSAQMFFKDIFVYDALLNPKPVFNMPVLYESAIALYKAIIISACILLTVRNSPKDFLSFACWILASILVSPNGSVYSLILLVIPLLAFNSSIFFSKKNVITMIALLLICNIPVYYFSDLPVVLKFPRLYLLTALFVMIIYSSGVKLNHKLLAACFVLFLLPLCFKLIFQWEQDNSSYVLSKEQYLLMYDYDIRDGKLFCRYWSDAGSHEEPVDMPAMVNQQTDELTIEHSQVYYKGKQITHTPDNKLKPMLVNGNTIIYLSDKNRGVGMYTLRKLKLR
jgi:hypothetical protein